MKQEVSAVQGAESQMLQKKSSLDSYEGTEKPFITGLFEAWLKKQLTYPYAETGQGLRFQVFRLLESMEPEEQEWKNAFLESLVKDGLIGKPDEVTLDETHKIIFMQRSEKEQWRDELRQKKSIQSGDNKVPDSENREAASEGRADWQEKVKHHSVGIDRQAKVQMEVLMRPEVRPDIIALGVAHGMAGQKYIEHLIVDAVNKNDDLVTKGKQYIKRAKGSIRRAIALAQEDGANLSQDSLDTSTITRHR